MTDMSLDTRPGLPDALRALVGGPARPDWAAHPEFGPLTQFWLDKHLAFRNLLAELRAEATDRADGRLDPARHDRLLMAKGGALLQGLEQHHMVEDHIYFPKMTAALAKAGPAFELLDADHHALHDALAGVAEAANGVLRGQGEVARLEQRLDGLGRFLDRHLTDEEEVVVPVILQLGERRFA
jgi:iron-sulfur cluster repair protein YtfE (RIC family)